MRFEVNVDDGNNLNTLHKARAAFNEQNPTKTADDLPTFVQRLMDQAVANVTEGIAPTTLGDALSKIADLERTKAELEKELEAHTSDAIAAKPA